MKLLLVEDDIRLCHTIKKQLSKEGFIIDVLHSGEEAFIYALSNASYFDLMIIDRMLPIIDGLSIVKAMRKKNIEVPIIVITGMSELDDKIEGLDCGADDYLTKPFHIRELSARIRALTRRPLQIACNTTINYEDISLNGSNRQLCTIHSYVVLTPKEYHLIHVFLSEPNTIFSREQLMLKVWESDSYVEQGNIDNYIYFLRKRLKSVNSTCQIRSVYGCGFILEAKHD